VWWCLGLTRCGTVFPLSVVGARPLDLALERRVSVCHAVMFCVLMLGECLNVSSSICYVLWL